MIQSFTQSHTIARKRSMIDMTDSRGRINPGAFLARSRRHWLGSVLRLAAQL